MGRRVVSGAVLFLWVVAVAALSAGAGELPAWAVAKLPTPVFSDPAFPKLFGGADGKTLMTDRCGQLRSLEFMAPQGSVFTIRARVSDTPVPVYRVTTAEYPYHTRTGNFVDGRFLDLTDSRPPERPRTLPPLNEITRRLLAATGRPYVWGGNVSAGIPELLGLYPPPSPLPRDREQAWTLAGLDCSGLLYEATGGYTPRNTSSLIRYGKPVPIAGRNARNIALLLRPLDLIVWNGHVMIVIDSGRVIESRLVCGAPGNGGVIVRTVEQSVTEVMRSRKPVDDYPEAEADGKKAFVIRRWYTGSRTFPTGGTP